MLVNHRARGRAAVTCALKLALFWWCLCFFYLGPPAFAQQSKLSVALFVDRGASAPAKRNFKRVLSNSDEIEYQTVYGDDIGAGALRKFDALVVRVFRGSNPKN